MVAKVWMEWKKEEEGWNAFTRKDQKKANTWFRQKRRRENKSTNAQKALKYSYRPRWERTRRAVCKQKMIRERYKKDIQWYKTDRDENNNNNDDDDEQNSYQKNVVAHSEDKNRRGQRKRKRETKLNAEEQVETDDEAEDAPTRLKTIRYTNLNQSNRQVIQFKIIIIIILIRMCVCFIHTHIGLDNQHGFDTWTKAKRCVGGILFSTLTNERTGRIKKAAFGQLASVFAFRW